MDLTMWGTAWQAKTKVGVANIIPIWYNLVQRNIAGAEDHETVYSAQRGRQ
jgi:hypothetical protein